MFIASSDIITQNQKQHNDYSQGSDKTTEAAANRVLFSNESEPTITTHGVLSTSQRSQTLVQMHNSVYMKTEARSKINLLCLTDYRLPLRGRYRD